MKYTWHLGLLTRAICITWGRQKPGMKASWGCRHFGNLWERHGRKCPGIWTTHGTRHPHTAMLCNEQHSPRTGSTLTLIGIFTAILNYLDTCELESENLVLYNHAIALDKICVYHPQLFRLGFQSGRVLYMLLLATSLLRYGGLRGERRSGAARCRAIRITASSRMLRSRLKAASNQLRLS